MTDILNQIASADRARIQRLFRDAFCLLEVADEKLSYISSLDELRPYAETFTNLRHKIGSVSGFCQFHGEEP